MKLRKELLKDLLVYPIGITVLNEVFQILISPNGNYLFGEEIKSSIFIGVFTGIAVYFNHFTLKGKERRSSGTKVGKLQDS